MINHIVIIINKIPFSLLFNSLFQYSKCLVNINEGKNEKQNILKNNTHTNIEKLEKMSNGSIENCSIGENIIIKLKLNL